MTAARRYGRRCTRQVLQLNDTPNAESTANTRMNPSWRTVSVTLYEPPIPSMKA